MSGEIKEKVIKVREKLGGKAVPVGDGQEVRIMQGKVDEKRLKRVVLGEWEEYVGWLEGVEEGPDGWVAVFDRAAIVLPPIETDLRLLVGKRVGILRTDDQVRPVRGFCQVFVGRAEEHRLRGGLTRRRVERAYKSNPYKKVPRITSLSGTSPKRSLL